MAQPSPVREDRREQIFAAGARLFAEKGYERTSLQDVADALGVTKPAFYYYYRSKEELLFEILSFSMDRVTDDIKAALCLDAPPEERVREWIRRYVRFFTAHPHELTLLSTAIDSLGPDRRERLKARQRRYLDMARRLVAAIKAPGSGLDDTVSAFALLGMMNWIFQWYRPAGPVAPEALADHFYRIFVYGVSRVEPGGN
ncbi:TetR/AcrR family transcriptional regulator [Deferrisoma camini]|uniref:TetR/AcrR family transcriptional regulator n=1 Tax=Deferrisoma camini TaxID=1035120 RepID=UPI0004BC2C12|nr:TetR/AcrR family transcriptional regulator [Deferrisoma camini]